MTTVREGSSLQPLVIDSFASLAVASAVCIAAPMLLSADMVTPMRVLAACIVGAGFLNVVAMYRWPSARQGFNSWATLLLGCAALGTVLYLRSCPSGALQLDFPLKGEWRVITGGRTGLMNYHHGQPVQQNYAVDLVLSSNQEQTLGQTVFSPCVCTVAKVTTDTAAAEGNLVVLKTSNSTHIWLAHLKEESITVTEGEAVNVGTPIAQVGDTGSADSAHLHIHAEKDGHPVAMVFGAARKFLVRGDMIR